MRPYSVETARTWPLPPRNCLNSSSNAAMCGPSTSCPFCLHSRTICSRSGTIRVPNRAIAIVPQFYAALMAMVHHAPVVEPSIDL